MKKRVLALLLAGLITASMASCVSEGKKNPNQTNDPAQSTVAGPQTPTDQFQEVNETVYAIVNNASLLTDVGATTAAAVVPQLTELRRVKYSAAWSVVEYNGAYYYVASQSLTADDIMGKGFTPCEPKTMYATSGLKIRPYASLNDSFSKEITTIKTNDSVIVIAYGTIGALDWSKIKYTDANGTEHEYFVSSKYLSATQTNGQTDVDYSKHFDDCDPKTMYIAAENTANVRTTPEFPDDDSNLADSLAKNTKVEVIAVGKGSYEGWSQIKYPLERTDPADPQYYAYGYIKTSLLSAVQGGEVATLETLLDAYNFEKVDPAKTMYVAKNVSETLNVRSSPDFSSNAGNVIGSVTQLQAVLVVAQGSYEGTFAYIITYGENGYGFVSGKFITTDPDGAPMLTLDAIVDEYDFEKLTAKDYYAKSDVNCRLTPESTEVAKKLTAGNKVSVVASGSYMGAELFILEINGVYYFAAADLFTENAPQG